MAIVIQDREVEKQIEQLAVDLNLSPVEVVRRAVGKESSSLQKRKVIDPEVARTRMEAIREAQEWFAARRNLTDRRSADQVIGYNENGLFD